METLGKRLKYARNLRGLSQQELSDLSGVKLTTIGNAESPARQQGRVLCITELAAALRVNPEWLARGEGPIEPAVGMASVAQVGISAVAAADIMTLTQEELALIRAYRVGDKGVRSLLNAAAAVVQNHMPQQRRRA